MRFPPLRLLAFFLCTAALPAAPAWKAELTSPAKGPHPDLKPIALDFQLSWKGMIDAGTIRMEFAPPDVKKRGAYVIRSSSRSQGVAARLYPYQSHFWSEVHPGTLRPRFFQATEIDKKSDETTTIRYFDNRVESKQVEVNLKTRASKTSTEVFPFAPVFDIYSAMLHIRSQRLAPGDRITLLIHPFDNPYLLRVRCHGRENLNGRPAIRLTVGMQKIDRKTLQLLPYKKLKRDATLWISDDADRIPIEFRAAVFIGDVRASLVRSTKL